MTTAIPETRPPALRVMGSLGLEPDPWQARVLESRHHRILLNCSRQAGKSTTVAILGLTEALFEPGTQILLLSRSHRQSTELFRLLRDYHLQLRATAGAAHGPRVGAGQWQSHRVSAVPGGYHPRLCRHQPAGDRRGGAGARRPVPGRAPHVGHFGRPTDLPVHTLRQARLLLRRLGQRRRRLAARRGAGHAGAAHPAGVSGAGAAALGEWWFRQEYLCSFEALEGLVYPDFARCVAAAIPAGLGGRQVGGIDFGFRNPFAAVWGTLDRDDVLWLTGEHYSRGQPLSHHAQKLPRQVEWSCDPAGAGDRSELRCAGFCVREGNNAVRPGIAAVTARLEDGRLRVVAGCCPTCWPRRSCTAMRKRAGPRRPRQSTTTPWTPCVT